MRVPAANSHRLAPCSYGQNIAIDRLRVPGKNGWLCILYVLMIWREAIGEGDIDDWEMAVMDVGWVTGRLCEATFYNAATEDVTRLKR